jgi:hypothetical protein
MWPTSRESYFEAAKPALNEVEFDEAAAAIGHRFPLEVAPGVIPAPDAAVKIRTHFIVGASRSAPEPWPAVHST